jgi:hypothetical protein
MQRPDLIALLNTKAAEWRATGSRVICSPAPKGTDEDFIAYAGKSLTDALRDGGFAENTDPEMYADAPDFFAFRRDEFNVIVTRDHLFYCLFCNATEQAKERNLLDKAERIALFQDVLYGNRVAPDIAEVEF